MDEVAGRGRSIPLEQQVLSAALETDPLDSFVTKEKVPSRE